MLNHCSTVFAVVNHDRAAGLVLIAPCGGDFTSVLSQLAPGSQVVDVLGLGTTVRADGGSPVADELLLAPAAGLESQVADVQKLPFVRRGLQPWPARHKRVRRVFRQMTFTTAASHPHTIGE